MPEVVAGRFELHELAGSGGFGSVWRARDLALGRTVALKLLRDLRDPRAREMRWEWVDGSPLAYEHWDGGEPNDGDGADCAVIMTNPIHRASRWADRACDDRRPYVCEAR